ncbi:MAG: hypothetical protein KGQ88_10990 [Chloroflexi bacterium]|nr:hypothetical protein [Chloroflexota bacterium]
MTFRGGGARAILLSASMAAAILASACGTPESTPGPAATVAPARPGSSSIPLADTGVTVAKNSDKTLVILSLDPGRPGNNTVRVDLRDALGTTILGSVRLDLAIGGTAVASSTFDAARGVPLAIPRAGRAEMTVTALDGAAKGSSVAFSLELPVARPPDGTLAAIDSATTSLRTLREKQTLTAGGPVLHFDFQYLAPDRVRYTTLLPTGVTDETVLIGRDRYDREGTGAWTKSDIGFGSKVPSSDFAPHSTRVRVIGHETVDGQELVGISFVENAAVFYTIWVGAQDHLVRRYEMMTMGHYMTGSYSGFDAALVITAP